MLAAAPVEVVKRNLELIANVCKVAEVSWVQAPCKSGALSNSKVIPARKFATVKSIWT